MVVIRVVVIFSRDMFAHSGNISFASFINLLKLKMNICLKIIISTIKLMNSFNFFKVFLL